MFWPIFWLFGSSLRQFYNKCLLQDYGRIKICDVAAFSEVSRV